MMAGESGAVRIPLVIMLFRRPFLASLAVAVVVLGLVGMHAMSARADSPVGASVSGTAQSVAQSQPGNASQLTMNGNGQSAHSARATIPVSAGQTPVGAVSADGCARICAADRLPAGMVCVRSGTVAMSGMLLVSAQSPAVSVVRERMRVPRIGFSTLVPPSTPSLQVLSISRT